MQKEIEAMRKKKLDEVDRDATIYRMKMKEGADKMYNDIVNQARLEYERIVGSDKVR